MKRWHQELTVIRREWKKHWVFHVEMNRSRSVGYRVGQRQPGSDPNDVDCPCDNQVGRFRKRDAHDCGRPGCFLCHGDKFPRRRLTIGEQLAETEFKEQLEELWEDPTDAALRRIEKRIRELQREAL
ncbi:MAG TPA: hypothetical protein VEL76_22170 [Gemmataceae bacterium]|nr:hypothetical protein [Gemmataceae bacterium]